MNKKEDRTTLALLATVGFTTIYGFSFMASRIALQNTNASVLLVIRFAISALLMLILIAFGIFKVSLKGKPVGRFLLMGLCQPVIYFIGETLGIQYTNSSFAGIMISLIPVATAIMSAVFLHEHIKPRTMLWIICSIIGVFIISTAQTSSGVIQTRGILYLLLAVVSASAFYIFSRSVAEYPVFDSSKKDNSRKPLKTWGKRESAVCMSFAQCHIFFEALIIFLIFFAGMIS